MTANSFDFFLEWGQDLVLSSTGTIQTATGLDRVRQRIIRRFLTNGSQVLPNGNYTPPD